MSQARHEAFFDASFCFSRQAIISEVSSECCRQPRPNLFAAFRAECGSGQEASVGSASTRMDAETQE